MPNWVTAKLTIEGLNSNEVMKQLLTKNEDGLMFDFNKIIAMPKELEIIKGSLTDECIDVYLTYLNPEMKHIGEEFKSYELFNTAKSLLNNNSMFRKFEGQVSKENIDKVLERANQENLKTIEDLVNYGKKAVENLQKYESMDWYDWSCKNWGTKWNACHTVYNEEIPNEVYFDTAWGEVSDLIYKLSALFPDNTFTYEYAEEWVGNQTGFAKFQNEKILENAQFEDGSKEAYEQAFKLWGEDLKDYYKFNEKTNTYESKEKDEGEME